MATQVQDDAPAKVQRVNSERVLLWILLVVYIFNFIDRQVVNILAEPIKRDLDLSDTQLGLLTGLAFALFYAILGVPIARYADKPHSNRVGLISISLLLWSAMTAVSGLATNFTQLLLARVGVGVGEAGCTPAAHSLISDMVPRERRASAIAFYGLGIPIGGLLGMVIGGQLNDLWGWRTAFFVVGAPGILLSALVWLVLRDPRVSHAARKLRAATVAVPQINARAALKEVLLSKAFVQLALGAGLIAFLAYGKGVWVAILFMRNHGLSPGETGLWLGLSGGIAGFIGTWAGGYLADRFGKGNPRHLLTAPVVGIVLAAPLLFLGYRADNWVTALALLFIPGIANMLYWGPTYSLAQRLVRPHARAMATAIMVFAQNLIGLGLGPLLFGMLSDALKPIAGPDSVRWVLYGAAWLGVLPAFFFWRASLRLKSDLDPE
jgi:predicted MFS family arabinose efflux permease